MFFGIVLSIATYYSNFEYDINWYFPITLKKKKKEFSFQFLLLSTLFINNLWLKLLKIQNLGSVFYLLLTRATKLVLSNALATMLSRKNLILLQESSHIFCSASSAIIITLECSVLGMFLIALLCQTDIILRKLHQKRHK